MELAIDDFGTGYSSLSYLLQLPAATLKIDQSFVAVLCRGGRQADFVRSIIALARSLDMNVIAEGVETEEQLSSLRALSCDFGQGYLFSRPVAAEEARALLSCSPFAV